jgi:hypothetical protein
MVRVSPETGPGGGPRPTPFLNRTLERMSCYEAIKVVLMCLTLIPLLRLIVLIIAVLLTFAWGSLITCGHRFEDTDGQARPLGPCRCILMAPARWLIRLGLFALGYHWIHERGVPCGKQRARVVVSNHVSFTEPLYFACRHSVRRPRRQRSPSAPGLFAVAIRYRPAHNSGSCSYHPGHCMHAWDPPLSARPRAYPMATSLSTTSSYRIGWRSTHQSPTSESTASLVTFFFASQPSSLFPPHPDAV